MRLPFAGRVISEVFYTFRSNDLQGYTWNQEKRQAAGAWIYSCWSFCFTLANNAVQEKHIHREENSWCWRCSTHMTHFAMACRFVGFPSTQLSPAPVGRTPGPGSVLTALLKTTFQSYFIWKESSSCSPRPLSRVNHKGCTPEACTWTELTL